MSPSASLAETIDVARLFSITSTEPESPPPSDVISGASLGGVTGSGVFVGSLIALLSVRSVSAPSDLRDEEIASSGFTLRAKRPLVSCSASPSPVPSSGDGRRRGVGVCE